VVTGPNRVLPVSPSAGTSDPLSALKAGRVVEARLSLALADGLFRFTSPGGEIDLPLPQALPAGTRVAISAQPGGGFQVAVLGGETPPTGVARPGQPMTLPALNVVVTPTNGDAGLPPLGRNVAATVIGNPAPGVVRVQAPGGEVDLPLARAVPEGTMIRLTAQRGGAAQVHVPAHENVVPQSPATSSAPAPTASLPSLSVFTARPVGEAPDIAPGKMVEARVVSSTPEGVVRVAAREGVFDLPIGKTLPPGTEVRIAAQPGGSLLMTVRTDAAAGARAPAPPPILVPSGPQVPVFAPGTTLTAHVAAATEPGAVRLTTPLGSFQLPVGQSLVPGAQVRIAVQPNGALMLTPEAPDIAARPTAAMTPAQAVQQNMRVAAARQDGMAHLFAEVEELPGRSDVPRDVRQAAQNVLDRRLPLDLAARPEQLAKAIAASGLFAERSLSMLAGQKDAPPDLKLALFVLRAALGSSGIRTDAQARPEAHLPPPQAGSPPAAQAPAAKAGQGMPLPPEQILPRVAAETEAGLSRINLHQIASLPDDKAASMRGDQPDLRWSCEVPVNVDGRTAMFGFVIERDGHRAAPEHKKKNWRVRAALDLQETGAVEADVRLSGEVVAAGLLAERAETAALLEAALPMLRDGLTAAGFEVETLSVRIGRAVAEAGPPGHFMDLRS